MHAIGHAGGVRAPGGDVAGLGPVAHQIVARHPRPDQVLRAQHGKGARHAALVQIARLPHHILKQGHLRLGGQQRKLPRLGKTDLPGQERDRGQPVIPVARYRRGGDRHQRAAQTVAQPMHPRRAADRAGRLQRRHHALCAVIVKAQIAIRRVRVLPRDAEHREPLPHQPADQRVFRRQIKDIVFHDPGRHDQDRHAVHLIGRGRILDQLDQVIAEHDRAGGDRHAFAGAEIGVDAVVAALDLGRDILGQIAHAAQQVRPPRLDRAVQHLRVGRQKVRG